MTIQDKILRHLKGTGTITAQEAMVEYGTLRLSAYIYNLRKEGHSIKTKKKQLYNGKNIAKYVFIKDETNEASTASEEKL
jgi:hypothetical protein